MIESENKKECFKNRTKIGNELCEACSELDVQKVKQLLEKGADPNSRGPFKIALSSTFCELEEYKDKPEEFDDKIFFILDLDEQVVKKLRDDYNRKNEIEFKKSPEQRKKEINARNQERIRKEREIMNLLISYGADVNYTTWHDRTPLMEAIICGRMDIFEYLLEKGADINKITEKDSIITVVMKDQEKLEYVLRKKPSDETFYFALVKLMEDRISEKRGGFIKSYVFDWDLVEFLFSQITEVYNQPIYLIMAVFFGKVFLVEKILDKYPDLINKPALNFIDGNLPICVAVKSGNFEMFKLLVDRGADLSLNECDFIQGPSFLQNSIYTAFTHINLSKDKKMLDYLLQHYQPSQKELDYSLIFYCEKGDIDNVKKVVELGANVNCKVEKIFDKKTPYSVAISKNNAKLLEYLKSKGAYYCEGKKELNSLLKLDYKKVSMKQVEQLIKEGYDVNEKDINGKAPLIKAYKANRYDLIELLIKNQANPNIRPFNEWILNSLLAKRDKKFLHFLLEYGLDPNFSTQFERPLFVELIIQNQSKNVLSFLKMLFEYGADAKLVWGDEFEESVLSEIVQYCDEKTFNYILSQGAEPNAGGLISKVLFNAAQNDNPNIFKKLVAMGYNDFSYTSMDFFGFGNILVQAKTKDVVKILVDSGVDVHAKDKDGNSVLHFLTLSDWDVETVKILLDAGAEVNCKNHEGKTPLMEYISYPLYEESEKFKGIVQLLIDYGADPNTENQWGTAAVDFLKPK